MGGPLPSYDYSGHRVLVTGGSQGIGLGIARAFADSGADVLISGTRDAPTAYDDDLSRFTYIPARMEDPASRAALADQARGVSVLINNAGGGRADEYELQGFEQVIQVNLTAAMDLSVRLHESLKTTGGAIVNIGSVASFLALANAPAYTAAKAGILGLTKSLADKWARDGIRVNLIAPGFIRTRITASQWDNEAVDAKLVKQIPIRRWGGPDDIAGAALFLASGAADYITGTSILIDGGFTLR